MTLWTRNLTKCQVWSWKLDILSGFYSSLTPVPQWSFNNLWKMPKTKYKILLPGFPNNANGRSSKSGLFPSRVLSCCHVCALGQFFSPGILPMSGFQGGDPLGGWNIRSVRVRRAQQEVKTTAKQPPKDPQKTAKSSERLCFTRFRSCRSCWHFLSEDQKGMPGRGREKNVTTISDTSRQFPTIFRHVTTISDIFATCLSLCSCDIKHHKTS